VTKDLDFSLADRKAELLRWLSEDGRFAPDASVGPSTVAIDNRPIRLKHYLHRRGASEADKRLLVGQRRDPI
jgi:hypothetical protein